MSSIKGFECLFLSFCMMINTLCCSFLRFRRDEELLGQGLELNDSLQILLAKHDAIASGSVLPTKSPNLNLSPQQPESSAATQKASEIRGSGLRDSSSPPNVNNSSSTASVARSRIEEDDEEEDEFAQLARRLVKIDDQIFIFIHYIVRIK